MAVRSEELAVALSITPDSMSANAWPTRPYQALPRQIPDPTGLRAFRNVPSGASVRAEYAAFCTLVHSAAVLLIETDSIPAIGPITHQNIVVLRVHVQIQGNSALP